MKIGGVIIAGGRGVRMGGVLKPLVKLHDRRLIDYVIRLARPQLDFLVVNVSRHQAKFKSLGLPLVADSLPDPAGPLLGIAAAMAWYRSDRARPRLTDADALACFPADVPCFPNDIVHRLQSAMLETGAEVVLCRNGRQLQPLFSLWSCRTLARLSEAIGAGYFGPSQILLRFHHVVVEVNPREPGAFFNINTLADLAEAGHLISREIDE